MCVFICVFIYTYIYVYVQWRAWVVYLTAGMAWADGGRESPSEAHMVAPHETGWLREALETAETKLADALRANGVLTRTVKVRAIFFTLPRKKENQKRFLARLPEIQRHDLALTVVTVLIVDIGVGRGWSGRWQSYARATQRPSRPRKTPPSLSRLHRRRGCPPPSTGSWATALRPPPRPRRPRRQAHHDTLYPTP